MAIATVNDIVAGLGPLIDIHKASATTEGAGKWHSLWAVAGSPAAGATPPAFTVGSGYVPTNATTGALSYTNPVSGNGHLALLQATFATAGTLWLIDRLWHCSGFGTVVTTAQNVTTPGALPARDRNGATNGDGVELWGEVYTAPGATGATWTVSYTNQAGTSGRTATYTHPANAESVGQMFPFTLQAGDTGVQSVQSLTCSVSSGTAGNIGITLLRRIASLGLPVVNIENSKDWAALGLARIYDSSCLALMVQCTATNSGVILGSYQYTQG